MSSARAIAVVAFVAASALLGCARSPVAGPRATPRTTSASVDPREVAWKAESARLARDLERALADADELRLRAARQVRGLEERIAFDERVRMAIDGLDSDLQGLVARADTTPERARIAELLAMRHRLNAMLERVHTEPADTWLDLRVSIDAAMDDLKKAVERAVTRSY